MNNLIVTVVIVLLNSFAFSQSDCHEFRIGKYHNIKNETVTSVIERNDSIQTERYGDKFIKLKIQWIDDCSYRLIFLEGNDEWWESRGRDRPTPDLIVRITNIEGETYLQEAKFEGDDEFKYKSRIVKVSIL
ncbi:MAG: hypothetical protein QNK23_14300 [Crocinitomicaceae bacterium]|nr:hypothetical protein [Crocinitomicaceae bacterium]